MSINFKLKPLPIYQWIKEKTEDRDKIEIIHLDAGMIAIHNCTNNELYILDDYEDNKIRQLESENLKLKEQIKIDNEKFRLKLGWDDINLLDLIKGGYIDIVGEKNGELVYSITEKGKGYLKLRRDK
jgi:hypothetical protein